MEASTRRPVSMRRASHAEATAIWRGLVSGQWAVIERFDDGFGLRIVLAQLSHRAALRPWHRLAAREKAIVAAVAAGRSNRAIAQDLSISVSAVAGYLRAARKKLGGARRIDLVREWRATFKSQDEWS